MGAPIGPVTVRMVAEFTTRRDVHRCDKWHSQMATKTYATETKRRYSASESSHLIDKSFRRYRTFIGGSTDESISNVSQFHAARILLEVLGVAQKATKRSTLSIPLLEGKRLFSQASHRAAWRPREDTVNADGCCVPLLKAPGKRLAGPSNIISNSIFLPIRLLTARPEIPRPTNSITMNAKGKIALSTRRP